MEDIKKKTEETLKMCADCEDDLMVEMDRKARKLMYILHDLKHGDVGVLDLQKTFDELFPFWRDVEWYNPTMYNAVQYLFANVLDEKNTDELK